LNSLSQLQTMVDLKGLYAAESVPEVVSAFKVELQKASDSMTVMMLIGKEGSDHKVVHSDLAEVAQDSIVDVESLSEIPKKQLSLVCGGEAYGVLWFVELEKLSVEVLELATHFGIALYRVLQHEERSARFRQSALRLAMVRQTAGVIHGLDLESVLAKLMELCCRTVDADAGCIALRSSESNSLRAQTDLGFSDEYLQKLQLTSGQPLADVVAKEKVICLVKEGESFDEFVYQPFFDNLSSLLALPLYTRHESPGCIVLINPKEVDADQVKLLSTVIDLCSSAIDNALLHKSVLEKEVLRGQLEIAGAIQDNLLPEDSPELSGATFGGRSVSCDESGGDFYDYLRAENGDITFVLGDATGHGIGAALVATTVRAMVRAKLGLHPECGLDLAKIVGEINDLAEIDLPDDRFMTLIIGQFECATGKLSWVSAGHDPAGMLFRAEANQHELLESTGLPVGMFAAADYVNGATVQLFPGDLLLLMTDGITEAENTKGQQYGSDRVIERIHSCQKKGAKEVIDDLVDDVFAYVGDEPQRDDITLLCLKIDEMERAA